MIEPDREIGVRAVHVLPSVGHVGVAEILLDPLQLGQRRFDALLQQVSEFLLDLAGIFFRAQFVDEDFDPRLVLVVAPSVAVVDAQARLRIGDQLVERHEVADQRGDHRGAAHPAADVELRTKLSVTLDDPDTDIVQPHGRAILFARDHADLELARQVGKFGVEARPLAQQLGIGARVRHLVRRGACEMIRADVADAVAAGLDRVHLHARQIGEDVGRILQLDPVVLDVLPRGEVAVAAIVLLRDRRQHPHLTAVERAIGNRHAQHVGVQLQVEAVHQPQRLELVFAQLACQPAFALVAKLGHAGIDHGLVVLVVGVHQITCSIACGSSGLRVRSGRTVGPSARTRSLICEGRGVPSGPGAASTT